MLKYILFITGSVLLLNKGMCQQADTTVIYFKYDPGEFRGFRKVATLDSADFIRMILPPDLGDNRVNVKEFYKNGNAKFMGRYDPNFNPIGKSTPSGDCITYFPNGKRQSIIHYNNGRKDGDEYLFYPTGTIYCVKKNIPQGRNYSPQIINWECYDEKGTMICTGGNGWWKIYDADFNDLLIQGQVKKGLFEGDWHGSTKQSDSIKYTYRYSKGSFISGIGYDKNGVAYPFIHDVEQPVYTKNPIVFLQLLRSYLKVPRDTNGQKLDLKHASVSFTIEKDGSLSDPEIVGYNEPGLTNALKGALLKCQGWSPRTYYGIPLRSRMTLPYKEMGEFMGNNYVQQIHYQEEILGF